MDAKIVFNIFLFGGPYFILDTGSIISKQWNLISKKPNLWKYFLANDDRFSSLQGQINWKQLYILFYRNTQLNDAFEEEALFQEVCHNLTLDLKGIVKCEPSERIKGLEQLIDNAGVLKSRLEVSKNRARCLRTLNRDYTVPVRHLKFIVDRDENSCYVTSRFVLFSRGIVLCLDFKIQEDFKVGSSGFEDDLEFVQSLCLDWSLNSRIVFSEEKSSGNILTKDDGLEIIPSSKWREDANKIALKMGMIPGDLVQILQRECISLVKLAELKSDQMEDDTDSLLKYLKRKFPGPKGGMPPPSPKKVNKAPIVMPFPVAVDQDVSIVSPDASQNDFIDDESEGDKIEVISSKLKRKRGKNPKKKGSDDEGDSIDVSESESEDDEEDIELLNNDSFIDDIDAKHRRDDEDHEFDSVEDVEDDDELVISDSEIHELKEDYEKIQQEIYETEKSDKQPRKRAKKGKILKKGRK